MYILIIPLPILIIYFEIIIVKYFHFIIMPFLKPSLNPFIEPFYIALNFGS